MSAEAIIQQIKKDAEIEIKKIQKEADEEINTITAKIQKETNDLRKTLLDKGKVESENLKKIELSKANQEIKRSQLQKKEYLIEKCFTAALEQLKNIDDQRYETIVNNLLLKGKQQMNGPFFIQSSKPLDKKIAKKHNIPVQGSIESCGGIKLFSENGSITVDNTFEGILKRKKQDIRILVGNILFRKKVET